VDHLPPEELKRKVYQDYELEDERPAPTKVNVVRCRPAKEVLTETPLAQAQKERTRKKPATSRPPPAARVQNVSGKAL
jgi:hypothetical protein